MKHFKDSFYNETQLMIHGTVPLKAVSMWWVTAELVCKFTKRKGGKSQISNVYRRYKLLNMDVQNMGSLLSMQLQGGLPRLVSPIQFLALGWPKPQILPYSTLFCVHIEDLPSRPYLTILKTKAPQFSFLSSFFPPSDILYLFSVLFCWSLILRLGTTGQMCIWSTSTDHNIMLTDTVMQQY